MAEVISTIITNITAFVTGAVSWMGSFASVVADNALLFIFVIAVPLVGLGIGLLNRMFRLN